MMEVDDEQSVSPGSQESYSNVDTTFAGEDPSSGPMRRRESIGQSSTPSGSSNIATKSSSKNPISAPVKSACTFCRSRKSRCNGKQPCAACINRGRTDDCVYTISRRGGKPKPKRDKVEDMEHHLKRLFDLSEIPHLVRIPNVMPHLQRFQEDPSNNFYPFQQGVNPNSMLNQGQGFMTTGGGPYQGPSQDQLQYPTISSPNNIFTPPSIHSQSSSMPSSDSSATPSPKSLLKAYYTHMYRFMPILPDPKYLDILSSSVQPGSPLLLSLQCILPILRDQTLLPQTQPQTTMEAKKDAIRAEALFYARQAYDAIDEVLERLENQQDKEDASIIEIIQSLCILVIYEYGSGRALKSRLKVDAALTLAMSKGLHRLSASSSVRPVNNESNIISTLTPSSGPHYLTMIPDDEAFEVKKRLWWSLWMLAMWTAYNTGRIPTVRADDSRVTCELPSSADGTVNLWSNVISSLQGLLLVQDRVLTLAHIEHGRLPADGILTTAHSTSNGNTISTSPTTSEKTSSIPEIPPTFSGQPTVLSRDDILRSMIELDGKLQEQMQILEKSTQGIVGPSESGIRASNADEDETQRILKFLWAIQVYTTSLTLHIGQAFQGATLFERKLCFLSSISEANDAAACQVPMPNGFDVNPTATSEPTINPIAMATTQDLYARGPFLPRESLKRCVDASDKLLSISRNLRKSEGHMASPNPFNACSFVLISFVCLMQALAISSNTAEDDLTLTGNNVDSSNPTTALQGSTATSTLLRTAQSAAALTPFGASSNGNGNSDVIQSPPSSSFMNGTLRPSRQEQLQNIWARVKEAKDALQGLSKYWDMVIPMREEVSGCLEASQFLLSQQPSIDNNGGLSNFNM